jgi:SAM-dependent methyltransferase
MLEKEYTYYYGLYWPKASEEIYSLLLRNISKNDEILEIGVGSGHLLFRLALNKYHVSGIEIRQNAFDKVKAIFDSASLDTKLYCGNVLDHIKNYDFIFSTGLLQCLDEKERVPFVQHVKKISKRCIYVVPEVLSGRNTGSGIETGVSGCAEYSVAAIPMLLSEYYNNVRLGRLEKVINNTESFLYYICY